MNLPDLAALVRDADPAELPALAGRLREAELLAEMRLRIEVSGNGHAPADHQVEPEALLTLEGAMDAVGGVSRKWLLRHTRGLKFRRDLSRKVVRFERAGLLRWAASRRA